MAGVSFRSVELGGNWGSTGWILLDPHELPCTTNQAPSGEVTNAFALFNHELNNTPTAAAAYSIPVNRYVTNLVLMVGDITSTSQVFVDDLVVFGPDCPSTATATAVVQDGLVVGATITEPGCGYTNPPTVLIIGSGTGASATATVNNGAVTGINITNPGSGYGTNTVIRIASPPFMPWLEIGVKRVGVTLHVVLGRNYVLESSFDCTTWSQVGVQFTAQAEVITQEFEVNETGRYFRVRQVL